MNSASGPIFSNQIRLRSQSGDWERGIWTNANENKQNIDTHFSRSQSPDWERKRKPVESFKPLVPNLPIGNANENRQIVHGSLSYKINLAYIMNSTTDSIFSN